MKNLKGALPLLKSRQVELKLEIKGLTEKIDKAKSMQESMPYIEARLKASLQLRALPCEIKRVGMEVKRLNGSYSNDKVSNKPLTKLKLKGSK